MSALDSQTVWLTIIGLGIGTYLIRFSFIGLIGNRPIPDWLMRLLRYVPVAVLPGMVAPLVLYPAATQGNFDPARMGAALVALAVGALRKSVLEAIIAGLLSLYALLYLLG